MLRSTISRESANNENIVNKFFADPKFEEQVAQYMIHKVYEGILASGS
ncbi:MAG: hypothetical protein JXA44_02295 [Methanospirillaceae archaeon]|nr:hypothetical protein [Methanospirillaceae archaeon]